MAAGSDLSEGLFSEPTMSTVLHDTCIQAAKANAMRRAWPRPAMLYLVEFRTEPSHRCLSVQLIPSSFPLPSSSPFKRLARLHCGFLFLAHAKFSHCLGCKRISMADPQQDETTPGLLQFRNFNPLHLPVLRRRFHTASHIGCISMKHYRIDLLCFPHVFDV